MPNNGTQTEGQPQVGTSGLVCAERAWTPSHREEVISALWFIVAFVALDAGCPRWVFLIFFVKACMDTICAIQCAVREWWREDSHTGKNQAPNEGASNQPAAP